MTRIKFALICLPATIASVILSRTLLKGIILPTIIIAYAMLIVHFAVVAVARARWEYCEKKTTVPDIWFIFHMALSMMILVKPFIAILCIFSIIFIYFYGLFLNESD